MARKSNTRTEPKAAKSIQAEAKKYPGRSYVSRLNDECKKFAYNDGVPWDDDEVSKLVNLVTADKTTYEMALELGRSFYSAQTARSHVRFAINHTRAFARLF